MITKWYPGITLPMDPDAIHDHEIDFEFWLAEAVIETATSTAVGCSVGQPEVEGSMVKFRVTDLVAVAGSDPLELLDHLAPGAAQFTEGLRQRGLAVLLELVGPGCEPVLAVLERFDEFLGHGCVV